MAVEALELSHDTGIVLFDNTVDRVFGPIFRDVPVEAVEQFIKYCTPDVRTKDENGDLAAAWEAFKLEYTCFECGEGSLEFANLTYETCCFGWFCPEHEGEQWSDGTIPYGHKC